MIDKYKRPRVQRMVPWRGEAPKPSGLTLQRIKAIVAHLRMHTPAGQAALISGAMPSEVLNQELRADWQ